MPPGCCTPADRHHRRLNTAARYATLLRCAVAVLCAAALPLGSAAPGEDDTSWWPRSRAKVAVPQPEESETTAMASGMQHWAHQRRKQKAFEQSSRSAETGRFILRARVEIVALGVLVALAALWALKGRGASASRSPNSNPITISITVADSDGEPLSARASSRSTLSPHALLLSPNHRASSWRVTRFPDPIFKEGPDATTHEAVL
eukprot:TRINITY_DN45900_c0_g1_i1.p1 TRINITY_DN45900_c0_g1~~TRINITY_DN45900_c0_g1_i1.p1  ORF type:complete len:205 (+),score=39.59 TRINITY_DN45900_c0_g1_i1:280-894(+)